MIQLESMKSFKFSIKIYVKVQSFMSNLFLICFICRKQGSFRSVYREMECTSAIGALQEFILLTASKMDSMSLGKGWMNIFIWIGLVL